MYSSEEFNSKTTEDRYNAGTLPYQRGETPHKRKGLVMFRLVKLYSEDYGPFLRRNGFSNIVVEPGGETFTDTLGAPLQVSWTIRGKVLSTDLYNEIFDIPDDRALLFAICGEAVSDLPPRINEVATVTEGEKRVVTDIADTVISRLFSAINGEIGTISTLYENGQLPMQMGIKPKQRIAFVEAIISRLVQLPGADFTIEGHVGDSFSHTSFPDNSGMPMELALCKNGKRYVVDLYNPVFDTMNDARILYALFE